MKKFFAVIGNPPYQEEVEGNGRQSPIYNHFMDESYKVSDRVELVTPARFLFNAGQTPKDWNAKMLSDEHLKILKYIHQSSDVFPGTSITAGIAISYHDVTQSMTPIELFIPFPELASIEEKVAKSRKPLSSIVVGAVPYSFTEKLREELPEVANGIPKSFDLRSNVFNKYENVLFHEEPLHDESVKILGLSGSSRVYRYIKRDFINCPRNFEAYKVLLSESNGAAGTLGDEPVRLIGNPTVEEPNIGHTQTFISIGCFDCKSEADSLALYLKTKFCRVMLGILKRTQHNPSAVWERVPIQDFTSQSDIDWSKPIPDIDRQLYAKYGLSPEEIEFIETHVQEMG